MRNILLLLLVFLTSPGMNAQSVKVMSYNIRLDTQADGVNQWKNRPGKVINLIKKYNPDLFGVQEAMHNQMQDLQNGLAEYSYVGRSC